MKLSNQLRLTRLFDAGYIIQIENGPFVTENCTSIGKQDYDDDDSPYVYSDETYSDEPLDDIDVSQVKVLKPVNWLHPDFDYSEDIDSQNFIDTEE